MSLWHQVYCKNYFLRFSLCRSNWRSWRFRRSSGKTGTRDTSWHPRTNQHCIYCSGRIWEQACPKGAIIIEFFTRVSQRYFHSFCCVVLQVHRVLPQWLAHPDVIHRDIKGHLVPVCNIAGLSSNLRNKLHHNGIDHFFPGENWLESFLKVFIYSHIAVAIFFLLFRRLGVKQHGGLSLKHLWSQVHMFYDCF